MRDELEYEIDLLQGLLCDAELRQYYLEYINNVAPLLDHTFSSNFNSPRTPPQHLARYFPPPILQLANNPARYAMCAFAARAYGYSERANQLISIARSYAGA